MINNIKEAMEKISAPSEMIPTRSPRPKKSVGAAPSQPGIQTGTRQPEGGACDQTPMHMIERSPAAPADQ
jgi:hypothetical protein